MIKVVKFYADWCGPCRIYAKTFDKVTEELKDSMDEAELKNFILNE